MNNVKNKILLGISKNTKKPNVLQIVKRVNPPRPLRERVGVRGLQRVEKCVFRGALLLLIILMTSSPCVLAIQESNVISDSAKQKKLLNDLEGINPYSNNFFTPRTPHLKEIDTLSDKQKEQRPGEFVKTEQTSHGTIAPVKRLRLKIQNNRNPKKVVVVPETPPTTKNQAVLDCDFMEYFAEKTELEANGDVVMFFPENNSTIKADKVVYNQTSNLIKAFGHVVLINDGKEIFGDYMNIDLNEENALMDNPITDVFQVHAIAKKGYMYGDKLIQEQGSMYVTKKTMIDLKAEMFGPDLSRMYVDKQNQSYFMKDSHGKKFKIKTNDLIINAKKEHDIVTLKHAEIYFNERKIATIPSITMHTNKNQDYLEADYPEIGTMTNMGLFAGPGFVFDTPKGTTLKVVPILNYQGNGDDGGDSSIGWGALMKFKSATNKTDFGYGTANKTFIMRGLQRLDDNLFLQYAANSWLDDWFLGFRMPKAGGEVVYQNQFSNSNFFGKDKDMTFTHRAAVGYMQDGNSSGPMLDGEGYIGTVRGKYMLEAMQTLYKFSNETESPINARLDLVGQGSAAIYGAGGTQLIARIGPRIHSQYHNWMQDVGYFLSSYNDQTPLNYDRYMYGRSNAYLQESYRISKYFTLSWLTSLNLSQDSWDGKIQQENSFFFAIGPDDVKLNIGYDTIRQQSFVTMVMHLDAKDSSVDYKKMTILNPGKLGKEKNQEDIKQVFTPTVDNTDSDTEFQKAEIVNIEEAL